MGRPEPLDCVVCTRRIEGDEQIVDCGDGPEHAGCRERVLAELRDFPDYVA